MSSTTLRWGIIGVGNVVEMKSGPSLRAANRSQIVAVMNRDKTKAEAYAKKHAIPGATDHADAILKNPEIDIVYIATPPSSHEHYVAAAARAGKHVLVEKPMALCAEQGERMIAACDKAGVQLFVAYYRRFYPQVQKIREIVRSGQIGAPVQAGIDIAMPVKPNAAWREIPEISGGGLVVDIASHRIDAMVFLLGEVVEASGVVTDFYPDSVVERVCCLSLKFQSGAVCSLTADFYSGRSSDRFFVHGTAGSVIAEVLEQPKVLLQKKDNTEEFTLEAFSAPHIGLFRHIEQVFAGEAENQTSGRDALITEGVLDASVRSHFPWHAKDIAASHG